MTTIPWTLFLDDERRPTIDLGQVNLALDVDEAKRLVAKQGAPTVMSLDHDLGSDRAGVKPPATVFLRWLIDQHLDGHLDLSTITTVIIHSRNIIGSANLASLWDSFARAIGSPTRANLRPRASLID